jgi:hypothetical protein
MRLFTRHKKAPHGGSAGLDKGRRAEMKPNKKMMQQKSPQVKRHNGPQSKEMLLLALFRYGRRIENAFTRVENAVRERGKA